MGFALAKIHPPVPRRGQLLARPALEARLRDALEAHRVVLVAAPAGYGKTALLVRALAVRSPPQGLAWVSLDPGDDLHRLLECLLAALDPFDLPWRVAPEGLLASALSGDVAGRQRAVDDLTSALDASELPQGTIVLDDLHHLVDEAALHLLARLVERLPPRWTLVLASRELPSALLARAAAAGELAQFREDDLQFSADEVRAWCEGLGLDADAARALHARTAGWAAGLRLALSGARGAGPTAAIDRAAFDFLATEVLAHLDADLRAFLLDTSVLHELDLGRCTALTGDGRAARWLDEIERRGLFASVVDDAGTTLRLHDLFRDALQHRLRVERPEDWPLLLARAADLETDPLRRQGLLLAAGRSDDAARALLAVAPDMNTGGAVQTVLRLLDAFAPAFAAGSAEWQRVAGYATLTVWRVQECERHFAAAEALYGARGDADAAQTMAARRSSVLVALGRIGEAEALLARLASAPLAEREARLLTATAAGWLRMERGEHDAVAPAFAALMDLLQDCRTVPEWANLPAPRQTACRGMAGLLQRWATGALQVAGDRPVPLRTFAFLVLGWRALWLGRFGEAQARLDEAMGDATWGGHEVIARNHALALQAALAVVRGQGAAALRAMAQRIGEQPAGYGGWGLWHVRYFAARIAAAAGDVARLRRWLEELTAQHDTLPDVTPQRLHPVAGLQGTLAVLEGDRSAARRSWQDVLEHEPSADLFGQSAEVRVRFARLCLSEGNRDAAAALLEPLLARADDGPRGAVFAGAELAALARADWTGRLDGERVATLRAWAAAWPQPSAAAASDAAAAGDAAAWSDAAAGPHSATRAKDAPGADLHKSTLLGNGEHLSARELEVVALIARGQSNKLIARALDLSPHTVKRHVANALGKLGLASRGQAAAWFHTRRP
ncbi:MAG TPA: LuxR C-terminal-related transcriptional regulator [Caldimonas sp.]|nr:LuxR C-terminal-related transcriptional regulator [Caldimonas sp.]HEX2541830.1 LuxR C-terminal-related transcriptional regulator [Caldimonas sp.]